MSWLGLSLGEFGGQVGQGYEIAQDWRNRQLAAMLERARARREELMLPLQLQELKTRIAQETAPTTEILGGPRGSEYEITRQFKGGPVVGQPRELIKGQPETLEQKYARQLEEGDTAAAETTRKQIQGLTEVKRLQNPMQKVMEDMRVAAEKGDWKGFEEGQKILAGMRPSGHPTMTDLIWRMQHGDKEAASVVNATWDQQEKLARLRASFRLFNIDNYYDPTTGQIAAMQGLQAMQLQKQGINVQRVGGFPIEKLISAQQVWSEARPALAKVMGSQKEVIDPRTGGNTLLTDGEIQNFQSMNIPVKETGRKARPIDAYDNASDQAIFQKIMQDPRVGKEAGLAGLGVDYLNNVLNLAAQDNLSSEGQALVSGLRRYAETMGRLRSILGLQATDQAMALTMSLLPGTSTPNSLIAAQRMNQLDQMIQLAINIPVMGGTVPGLTGGAGPGGAPQSNLDKALDKVFGPAKPK